MSATMDAEQRLLDAYRGRLKAELERADTELAGSTNVKSAGDPAAPILVVKGDPGPAELGGGVVLSGSDGDAWNKALEALGWKAGDSYAVISRPVVDAPAVGVVARLERIIEACDPDWIVALDPVATADVAACLGIALPPAGESARVAGRRFLALEGLEASLTDDALKRRVWVQMQPLATSTQ